jgi:UDP-glucose:tetrahydrobiopterin glucosyltransferase
MKIAILAPLVAPICEPQLGGSQALLADLARGLTARGVEVEVFAASGSEIPGVHVVDTGIDAERLASTLFRHGHQGPALSDAAAAAFARAYELIRRGDHDVVHNHAFDAPAIELAVGLGRSVVHTLHLPPEARVAAALRAAGRAPSPPVVAAVSESHARAWRAEVRVDLVLRNGVPLDRIPWSADGGPGALFAGRLSPEKGAAEAIEIAQRAGAPIVVIGSVYDPAYAVDRIERWRNAPGVRIEPAVPREELWQRMAESCAVLCPVQWDEPFGLVAAEAQAAGTPVIGFRRGGLSEVVRDGVTGALVDEGDLTAAARALAGVEEYGREACRRHAEAALRLEATIDAHEDLYGRLLRSGKWS